LPPLLKSFLYHLLWEARSALSLAISFEHFPFLKRWIGEKRPFGVSHFTMKVYAVIEFLAFIHEGQQ
jgi:hypothetical protein